MPKRIDDKAFRDLKRAPAPVVRTTFLSHRAKGGELVGNDYDVLLRTYLKRNKQNWFVGLVDKKSNALLDELADEILATIRGPKGKKFLTGSRKTGWAHSGVLCTVGHVLLALGRPRDAAEMFDLDWKSSGEISPSSAVPFMRAAWKLRDKALLRSAIRAFAEVRHEGFAHAKEWEKYKGLVATLAGAKVKEVPKGAAKSKVKAVPKGAAKAKGEAKKTSSRAK